MSLSAQMAIAQAKAKATAQAQAIYTIALYNAKIKRIHASYNGIYSFPVLNPLLPLGYKLNPVNVANMSDANFITFLTWFEFTIPFFLKDKWFVFDGKKWNINFFGNSGQMDHYTIPFQEYGININGDVVPFGPVDADDITVLTAVQLMQNVFVPINPPSVISELKSLTNNISGQEASGNAFVSGIQLTIAIGGLAGGANALYQSLTTAPVSAVTASVPDTSFAGTETNLALEDTSAEGVDTTATTGYDVSAEGVDTTTPVSDLSPQGLDNPPEMITSNGQSVADTNSLVDASSGVSSSLTSTAESLGGTLATAEATKLLKNVLGPKSQTTAPLKTVSKPLSTGSLLTYGLLIGLAVWAFSGE